MILRPAYLIGTLAFLLVFFLPNAVFAVTPYAELSERQKLIYDYVRKFIQPLPNERVFYHYGGSAPCIAMIEQGGYTGPIAAKYGNLSVKGGAIAGHGVYIAGNPHSSATYYRGGGVIARLEKGAPILDLTDGEVTLRLLEAGITDKEVYELPLDATVRYGASRDWWVIKGPTGVKFEPLDWRLIATNPDLPNRIHEMPVAMQARIADLLQDEGRDLEPIVRAIQHDLHGDWGSPLVDHLRPEILEPVLDEVILRSSDPMQLGRLWRNMNRSDQAIEAVARAQMRRLQSSGSSMSAEERANRFAFAVQAKGVSDAELVEFFRGLPEEEQDELRETVRRLALRDYSYGQRETAGRVLGRAARLDVDATSLYARMTTREQGISLKGMDSESLAKVLRESRDMRQEPISLLRALRGSEEAGDTLKGLARYTDQDLVELLSNDRLSSADRVDRLLVSGLLKDTDEGLLAKAWIRLNEQEKTDVRMKVEAMVRALENPKGPIPYLYQERPTIEAMGRLVGLSKGELPRASSEAARLLSAYERVANKVSTFRPPSAYSPSRFPAVNHCRAYLRENLVLLQLAGSTAVAVGSLAAAIEGMAKFARARRHDTAIEASRLACLKSDGNWRPSDDPSWVILGECTCTPSNQGADTQMTLKATWDGSLVQLAACVGDGD